MKICIIIPAYNEEANISKLLLDLKQNFCDILVVDDGSTDRTAEISQVQGAFVISHSQRQGKGTSIRDGFDFALKNNYEAVITMDGDGQHSAEDVPKFIEYAKNGKENIIIGNRMAKPKDMPFLRLMTNTVMSKIISLLCRQAIPDSQCGFRFISTDVLKNIFLGSSNFEIESEILIEASKKGYKISSIPIHSIYQGGKSRINPFLDTLRFFKFFFKTLWTFRR